MLLSMSETYSTTQCTRGSGQGGYRTPSQACDCHVIFVRRVISKRALNDSVDTIIVHGTILYSRSVDPWKLCVGIQYYIVHTYSMAYYTYGSTANILFLEPTALIYIYIYISKERRCTRIYMYVVLEFFKLKE